MGRFFARAMKAWSWILLIVLSIAIKWVSWYPWWIEKNYSRGFYPELTKWFRIFLGWLPFSVGDIFYLLVILGVLYKTIFFFRHIKQKKTDRAFYVKAMQETIFFFLFAYVLFNICWGLNYQRKGIASQLDLKVAPYTTVELDSLTSQLQQRANYYSSQFTLAQRDSLWRKRTLFSQASSIFQKASNQYSYLSYAEPSIKPSLFSYIGDYVGFQGYYNPFSGEGQVNTTIPIFLQPYVTTHEIAHQLGYASESEANFVGYLVCRANGSASFRYSMYFDLYRYALAELYDRDSTRAIAIAKNTAPQIKSDVQQLKTFYKSYKNPFSEIIWWGYDHFLKANDQPNGNRSYNEVIAWLMAYTRKYGKEALQLEFILPHHALNRFVGLIAVFRIFLLIVRN